MLLLKQIPLLLCGYHCRACPLLLAPALGNTKACLGCCPCPGVCSLLGSCPNALEVWDAPLGLSLPQCSLCQPAQPLSKSFHAVSYRLLFISASLSPHYKIYSFSVLLLFFWQRTLEGGRKDLLKSYTNLSPLVKPFGGTSSSPSANEVSWWSGFKCAC